MNQLRYFIIVILQHQSNVQNDRLWSVPVRDIPAEKWLFNDFKTRPQLWYGVRFPKNGVSRWFLSREGLKPTQNTTKSHFVRWELELNSRDFGKALLLVPLVPS
jgi:hypothetical protein